MHISDTDMRRSTPAIVLALVLLAALAAYGWLVLQQVRMAPGTLIPVPELPFNPAARSPDNLTADALPAQTTGQGWEVLSTAQKLALYPLAERWSLLSELQKRRWLALAQNFTALPPQEQARLHERMTEWASLSVQQRNQARLNYAVTKRLAPDDRRTQWDAYQALSEEDKRKLAARATPKPQGAATALLPVSPKKLAKVPAATNAPGNPANPPKIPPLTAAAPRAVAPALPVESKASEAHGAVETAPAAAPATTTPTGSAPPPTPPAPAEALPNPYLN